MRLILTWLAFNQVCLTSCLECRNTHGDIVVCQEVKLLVGSMLGGRVKALGWGMFGLLNYTFSEVNSQQQLLPGYDIQITVMDSAFEKTLGLSRFVEHVSADTKDQYAMYVGGDSASALQVGAIAPLYRLPYVGWSRHAGLGDRKMVPSYFSLKNLPGYATKPFALEIIRDAGWKRVGLLVSVKDADPTMLPENIQEAYKTELASMNVTLSVLRKFEEWDMEDLRSAIRALQKAQLNVFLLGDNAGWSHVACAMILEKVAGMTMIHLGRGGSALLGLDDDLGEYEQQCPHDKRVLVSQNIIFFETLHNAGKNLTCLPSQTTDTLDSLYRTQVKAQIMKHPGVPRFIIGSGNIFAEMHDASCIVISALQDFFLKKAYTAEDLRHRNASTYTDLLDSLQSVQFWSSFGPFEFMRDSSLPRMPWTMLQVTNRSVADLTKHTANPALPKYGFKSPEDGSASNLGLSDYIVWPAGRVPADSWENCPDGEERSWGECVRCPPGFVQDWAVHGGVCTPCPGGTYRNASMPGTTCAVCAAGKFNDEIGGLACQDCQPGNFSAPGSSQCTSCAPGRVAPDVGSESCLDCPTGLYQDEHGKTECNACHDSRITYSQGAAHRHQCLCPESSRPGTGIVDGTCVICQEGLNCNWLTYFTSGDAVRGQAEAAIRMTTQNQSFPKVLPGYWADATLSKEQMVEQLFKCTSEERCPGGAPGTCADHMEWLSCGRCAEGYYHEGEICKHCEGSAVLLVLMYMLGFIIIGVLMRLWNSKAAHVEVAEGVLASITVGLMINFVQTMGILGRLSFDFPTHLLDAFKFLEIFLFDMSILRPGCLVPDSLGSYYASALTFPPYLLGACVTWYGIYRTGRMVTKRFYPLTWDATLNSVGMLTQMIFISMAMSVFSIWECAQNPSGKATLNAVPYTICYEGEHIGLVAVGCIIAIFYLLLPVACYIRAVILLPSYVFDRSFALRYKSIYFKFNPCLWWYGFLHMLRSLGLALVPILSENLFTQYMLMLLIIIGFAFIHLKFEPYVDGWANNLESYETFCLIFILLLCAWFITDGGEVSKTDSDDSTAQTIAILILITMISCILGLLLVTFYGWFLASRPEKARKLKEDKVQSLISNLRGMVKSVHEQTDDELCNLLLRGCAHDYTNLSEIFIFLGLELYGNLAQDFGSKRLGTCAQSAGETSPKLPKLERSSSVCSSAKGDDTLGGA